MLARKPPWSLASQATLIVLAAIQSSCRAQAPDRTGLSLKIIPWVEDNFSKYDETVRRGLGIWAAVTDRAIVSTMPGRAGLFATLDKELRASGHEIRIIPGLKTMSLLDRFDSIQGWESVASEVALYDSSIVLLENEVAMKGYVDGEYELDREALRTGLSKLPRDVQYLWYPSIWGNDTRKRERNEVACAIVQDTLRDVRFLDQRYQGARAIDASARKKADVMLKRITKGRPTLPMLYFYGPNHPVTFWKDEQLEDALGIIKRRWDNHAEVVIYPGVKRWEDAALKLSKRLQSLENTRKP